MSNAHLPFVSRPLPHQPYPMRHDNLVQQGSLLWERARTCLQGLLDQAPRATDALQAQQPPLDDQALEDQALEDQRNQRWIDYWNGRAPYTPLSRRAVAEQSFLDHLHAAAQLGYYHGQLTRAQLLPLLTLLEGGGDESSPKVRVQTVALQRVSPARLKTADALVIAAQQKAPVAQLLYLPAQNPALLAFADRPSLEEYLLQNRSAVWPSLTRFTDADAVLSYQTAQLSSACKQWLSHCRRAYLEAARQAHPCTGKATCAVWDDNPAPAVYQVPLVKLSDFQAPEPAGDADNFTAFGSLSPDIPQSHRWSELKRQHQAMLGWLGDDLRAGSESPGWTRLKALLTALSNAQESAAQAADGLLKAEKLEDLYRLRYLPNPYYSALYHARVDGLRAEVDLQQALGLLTTAHVQLMNTMLSQPQSSTRGAADGIACALSLQVASTGDTTAKTRLQGLHGVVAFMATPTPATDRFVLIYWPGVGGGLEVFESVAHLERSLFRLSAAIDDITLQLSPITGDLFDYGLQGQLHACEQRASGLIERLPSATHQHERLEALQSLTAHTYEQLLVPVHAARDRAYVQLTEESFSESLQGGLPSWLKSLTADDRQRLKTLTSQYIGAVRASNRQLERDLPDLDQFANARLGQRLRIDFNLTDDVDVVIDIPDQLVQVKQPVAGSGAPGTPQQTIATAGPTRTLWTFARLAQHNIDADMLQRLGFMRVQVSGADATQRARVLAGIDLKYLRRTVTELNLAQACEDKIRQAFLGSANQHPYTSAHERECLLEPMRLMLHLHSEYARHQGRISASGYRLALLATDADQASSFAADGRDVQLRPARLTVGGSDTGGKSATLSGVTFIHDRIGGQTLLYLPDAPDHRCLREYSSLEKARLGLFDLTVDSKMVDYLADRAIIGSTASHKARIEEAGLRRFDGVIGVGEPWPTTTSLASHLLDAYMGQLVEAQRRRGRSNDALYLEQAALSHNNVFNYLKMAFGALPFVGTALALYDAWTAANAAVGAWRSGHVGEGLNQLEAMLGALIDAAIDIVPGAASAPTGGGLLARGRQFSMLARRAGAPAATKQTVAGGTNPFAGYQYTLPLDLSGLHPAAQGVYRGIYRHADGDFILRDGQAYRVVLHPSPQTWRLRGTATKTYAQPIALDPTGRWQTHGALYGTLISDGLAGGGGVLGYLGHRAADGLQPLWPAAIRERLPRWLVDRRYRRHFELSSSIEQRNKQLREQLSRHEPLIMEQAADPQRRASAEAACASDIEQAEALYALLQEHEGHVSRDFLRRNKQFQSEIAYIVAGRRINHANLSQRTINELVAALDQPRAQGELFDLTAAQVLEQRRMRLTMDQQFGLMEQRFHQAELWSKRVTQRADRAQLREVLESVVDADLEIARASNLSQLAHKSADVSDLSQMFHLLDAQDLRNRFHHGLQSHFQLLETAAGLRERQNVLRSSRQIYLDYRNQMNTWRRNRPERFDHEAFQRMMQSLDKLIDYADRMMPQLSTITRRPKQPGASTRRVFETHEHDFFIGNESRAADGEQIFTLTGSAGRLETYRRVGGQWRLQDDPLSASLKGPSQPLGELLAEGRKWLDASAAHERRVESYAVPGEAPANLEDLMVNQGKQLEMRAAAIERRQPKHELALRLRERARELRAKGRAMRIRQAMSSQQPTEGYLDYLLDQRQVDIVKLGDRTPIGTTRGEPDFLQEYVVRDITAAPPVPLWYAHFHYRRERAAFEQFDKAHLKRPEQRMQGLRWQQEQGDEAQRIWRGPIGKALAVKHFAAVQA